MSAESAPCRHAGAPPDSVVLSVSGAITELAADDAFLRRIGLSRTEFINALPAAIERLRGSAAASNARRRNFLSALLTAMVDRGLATELKRPKYGKDTVYRLDISGLGPVAIIQKGCPDGAHSSTRWQRPEWAVEAYLWWVCSSLKHQPGEHVALGVNRLKSRFFSVPPTPGEIDGVIFHNELCGSQTRPCPKNAYALELSGQRIPPPCIYVMPRREEGVTEWNWAGKRKPRFPEVLLRLFGISADSSGQFVGHVGFQGRPETARITIASQFGPGRSTIYRS